jgi:hypothetical protein
MKVFWGFILLAGALFLFSCSSNSNSTPTQTELPPLTWDAANATWDNVRWN